jgi:hypothetical protein
MATVTRPATSLPDPGDDLEAEPIRDYINNVLTFLEGNNIDDANVDFTSTDGIMALRKNQTVTGIKTHTGNIVLSGTATFDLNGIANALILDADADTHISAPTDDQIDIAIGGTDLIVLATAGSTFSHPVTVGVDDTGYDVKFFGATTGKYMLWDESADTLAVVGTAITLNGTAVGTSNVSLTGSTNNTIATVTGANALAGEANLTFDGTSLLEVRGPAANFGVVKISTAELTVVATDELGRIDFQAPLESSGSIGAAAGARISAVAEGTFSSTDNSTSLKFMTSSTAGVAERMRIDSAGRLLLGGTSTTSNWSPDAYINIEGAIPAITLRDTTPSADVWTLVNNNGTLTFANDTDNTSPMTITDGGNVAILGSLSKGSGSFKIRHPLPSRAGYDLVHSFIEGPQADLMYRGVVDLVGGEATINIDTAGRMTDGTFEALCTNVQSFTSNESNDDCVRGSVVGNVLTITSSNAASTARVSWMVIGERKDQHMIDTDWTDDDGRIITEPLTVVVK